MGAYLDTPVTTKQSSHGACRVGEREVVYASTAVQGWRVSMEDAHVIVPDFDEKTALLAVFDGHGGKEVAEYCSRHMPEMLQSNASYKSGDLSAALKELFMTTDKKLLEKDVIRELKSYIRGGKEGESDAEVDSSEEREEASKLMEEADMPLDTLLAQYVAGREEGWEEEGEEEGGGEGNDEARPTADGRVRSMLEALASQAGFEIEFDDSSDSNDSEYDDKGEDGEEESGEGEGENERGGGEMEGEGEWEGEGEREGEGEAEGEGDGEDEGEINQTGGREGKDGEEQGDMADRMKVNELAPNEHGQRKTDTKSPEVHTEPTKDGDSDSLHIEITLNPQLTVREAELSSTSTSPSLKLGNNFCLHNNTETSEPSDGELTLTEPDSILSVETQANGRTGVCEPHADVHASVESCAISSTCGSSAGTSRDRSSKSHLLLDLLTSTEEKQGPAGGRQSRKRRREGSAETSKKNSRGVLDEEGYHSGTTAVVCLLRESSLTVANAGDSRCVLSCRGRAVDMSEDHKPTDQSELSRIQRAGGMVGADGRVNGGLNLSRAIGDHFYKENTSLPLEDQMISAMPDVVSRKLEAEDEFIVLACDGIWNTKSSQEVVDFVWSQLSVRRGSEQALGSVLEGICELLCDACLASDIDNDGTGCDNMTVAIALLQPPSSLPPSNLPNLT